MTGQLSWTREGETLALHKEFGNFTFIDYVSNQVN